MGPLHIWRKLSETNITKPFKNVGLENRAALNGHYVHLS